MRQSHALGIIMATSAIVGAVPAAAQAETRSTLRTYAIGAGSMKAALDAWARQSKQQILYRSDEIRSLRSPGVRGRLPDADALGRILSGSGLKMHRDPSGAIAVTRPVASTSTNAGVQEVAVAPAAPEQNPTAQAASGIDDIVVTARRTEERAQKVPVSLTAFTQNTIREKGINTATDLQNFTPSLTVLGNVARNQETYTIRGMGGGGGAGTGSGPGVVGYFAEVPSSASGPGSFYDLASLQVLKGPQGTLFGRNTTGGAVLLEPARPKMNQVEG